jgi:hypothetical protein
LKVQRISWGAGSRLASLIADRSNQTYLSIKCGSQVLQSNLIDASNVVESGLDLQEDFCILLDKADCLISIELRAAYKQEVPASGSLRLFSRSGSGSQKHVLASIDILLNKEWFVQCHDQVKHFDAKWRQNSGYSVFQKPHSSGKMFSKSGFFTKFSASSMSLAKKASAMHANGFQTASNPMGSLSLSALYFSTEEEGAFRVLPESVDDYGRWITERRYFYREWFDGVLSIKTTASELASDRNATFAGAKYKSEGMLEGMVAIGNWKRRHLKWTGYEMALSKEDGECVLGRIDLRECCKFATSVENDLLSVHSILLVMRDGEEIEMKCSSKMQFKCLTEAMQSILGSRPKYWK